MEMLTGSKVMNLDEAVSRFIRPGMVIHAGNGWAFPTSLIYEIVRRFNGTSPGFTLASTTSGSYVLAPLLAAGLVKKAITSFWGDAYPYPGPNPVIQDAFSSGEVEVEEWTMLTIILRLMAGAMGIPFLTTKSILDSDIARVNSGFRAIENPFGESLNVGLVKALRPDISLAHGWMADPDGNTVINPPFAGGVWGALASKNGVVVTVEKIVPRVYLQKFRHLVKIPGSLVVSVSEVPFGSHPGGHHHEGVPEGAGCGYVEDKEFILRLRAACKKREDLHGWVNEWVIGAGNHEGYLNKLGQDRLAGLRGNLGMEYSRYRRKIEEVRNNREEKRPAGNCTTTETMIILAKRELFNIVKARSCRHLLAGIGASHLAAWLCYEELLAEGIQVDLLSEIGMFGYSPWADDPYLFSIRNLPSAVLHTDILNILGVYGANASCSTLGILGAAQVDKMGNINTSRSSDGSRFLVGSGGGNDIASGSKEVVVVAEQSKNRYVENVPFITSPGSRVTTLISQMGVFKKFHQDSPFVLAGLFCERGTAKQAAIEKVRELCGWELEIDSRMSWLDPPTALELAGLRRMDPEGFFLGKM